MPTPTIAYVSDNGVDEITLNVSSMGGAASLYIYDINSPHALSYKTTRNATGNFTLTGLTADRFYNIVAIPSTPADGSNMVQVFLGTHLDMKAILNDLKQAVVDLVWNTNKVFGFVKITSLPAEKVLRGTMMPAALIRTRSGRASPAGGSDYPQFRRKIVEVSMYSQHMGDWYGEEGITGGKQVADSSQGVGIEQLLSKVSQDLPRRVTANGIRYYVANQSESPGTEVINGAFVYTMSIFFEADICEV